MVKEDVGDKDQIIGNYRLLGKLRDVASSRVHYLQDPDARVYKSDVEYYIGEHLYFKYLVMIAIHIKQDFTKNEFFVERGQEGARRSLLFYHSHIFIDVLDYGTSDEGPFIVKPYIEGLQVLEKTYPRGAQLSPDLVVKYVSEVADALQYMHDLGTVHRDVKQDNMILDKDGEVLLTDFGLAVTIPKGSNSVETDIAGTLPYMAPEQLRGTVSPAVDQYALAVVAYEWISGARPFLGLPAEVLLRQISTPPPPLRERVPSISKKVEQVILKALSKTPVLRFPSVWEFAQALATAYELELPSRSTKPVYTKKYGTPYISIRITEELLSAQNLAAIIGALTDLYTKSWLIQQGRFADLMDYTQTHHNRFVKEAKFYISKITYNSPALIDFLVRSASIAGTATLALALKTAIDAIAQTPLRFRETQLKNQKEELEQKIRIQEAQQTLQIEAQKADTENKAALQDQQLATQKAQIDLEKQQVLLNLTKQQVEVEKQQLDLERQRLDLEKDRVKVVLEIAKTMVSQLQPDTDMGTREMLMQSLVPSLLQLAASDGLELALPEPQKSEKAKKPLEDE